MMPLCTTAISFMDTCGCALRSVTPPWVAHRVCPMPTIPFRFSERAAFSISDTRPTRRTRRMPPSSTAMPAES
jgi:hypothetical protein